MSKRFQYGPWVAGVALLACGGLVWKFYPRPAEAPAPPPAAVAPADGPLAETPPPEQHPIEQVVVPPVESTEPLPLLGDSDAAALDALAAALGGDPRGHLVGEFVVQRLVTTLDALPRASVTRQVYAGKPIAGTLAIGEADGRQYLDASNYARYDAAVRLFADADSHQLVATYVRFYPLFQQAYRELGNGEQSFNDRLVQVIDHLLAAPSPTGPIELVPAQGRPRWEFADPRLESASIGHKAMIRMGPDHAARVKAKLGELRTLLAGQRPAG